MTSGPPAPPAPPPPEPDRDRWRWMRFGALFRSEKAPIELQLVGRMLLHAAVVGAAAGLIGAAFFAGLEYLQKLVLEEVTGYRPLRAYGETFVGRGEPHLFRWYVLLFLPAIGALAGGWFTRFAPEARGGGGDQMIRAFHHQGGVIRRRVLWVKLLASTLTLGAGGSGGREGPTMQFGAALGSWLGRLLRVSTRERRILMLAGVAAGMAAVFRTPLGAALLAVEVLYRDDFEADALIPAILASVVAYSVVISMYGESTLFARAPGYPFRAAHLPLYALLAIVEAVAAATFVALLHRVEQSAQKLPGPAWARPAFGGLALGVLAVPMIVYFGHATSMPGQGLGILGGGYGAAQVAITGSPVLPHGWNAVSLLLILCAAKMVASALTIGSGGSAGDFAPSLVIGGILGGAFGRAAQLLFPALGIDPGAFALVGMGTFYGGIAHVPISSLIFVSELAGSYDLLVPLMLAEGIAFVALRNRRLYRAQLHTKTDSPVHHGGLFSDLARTRVGQVITRRRGYASFSLEAPVNEVLRVLGASTWQDVFPVLDETGALRGLISSEALRFLVAEGDNVSWAVAADLMQPPVYARADDELRSAMQVLLANGLRDLPVVDAHGRIEGFLDESDALRLAVERRAETPSDAADTDAPNRRDRAAGKA